MFSAFAALTYIAKGIKLMLTKKPTIGRVLRQVNWEQNGQRKQLVKSNTGSGWHLKLLTGTQAVCLLKYSTAILMCEWLVEKDELIYRKLQLPQESVSVCFSSKKNGVMTCHLCTKAMCLKCCMRVSGWWHLRTVCTACGFSTTDGYFFPVTISFILKEKFNVVYFEKVQTILPVLAPAKTWVFSF